MLLAGAAHAVAVGFAVVAGKSEADTGGLLAILGVPVLTLVLAWLNAGKLGRVPLYDKLAWLLLLASLGSMFAFRDRGFAFGAPAYWGLFLSCSFSADILFGTRHALRERRYAQVV